MSAENISITLPWPPSVNHYWRHARGITYISRGGLEYRYAVALLVRGAGAAHGYTERLSVSIYASPPDRRRRDIDNIAKSLLDALAHAGCYADDAQIDRLLIERGDVTRGGSVRVVIDRLPQS